MPEYLALLHYLEEYKDSIDNRLFSTPNAEVGTKAMMAAEWCGSKMIINLVKAVPSMAKDVIKESNSKEKED
jgi:hypothetical protein